MLPITLALVVLALAIGAIYWLLKSMGEDGIEVAAPGSCKSGRCGVRRGKACATGNPDEPAPAESDAPNNSR